MILSRKEVILVGLVEVESYVVMTFLSFLTMDLLKLPLSATFQGQLNWTIYHKGYYLISHSFLFMFSE